MSYQWYNLGTITLTYGSAVVTGSGTGWGSLAFARPGDALFRIASGALALVGEIASVESNTQVTLSTVYPGSTESGLSYKIAPISLARSDVGALSFDLATFVAQTTQLISGVGVPSNSVGEDGWIYIREDVPEYYKKLGGEWQAPVSFAGPQGIAGATYASTSTTSLTVGTGSKTLTVQASRAYQVGARARISSTATPTTYMEGVVTSYSGTTLIVDVDKTNGSGTLASWNVNIAGEIGPQGPTGASFAATSTTSLAIGTGSKAFTTQAGLAYTVGQRVRAVSASDAAKWMEGAVASYSGTTLTLTVDLTNGSGTLADWNINLTGERGAVGATGPSYPTTSTTSLAIGAGSKAFTVAAGLAYTAGHRARAVSASDSTKWMEGQVASYSGTTLTLTVDLTNGTGTLADWSINLSGERGTQGIQGASFAATSTTSLAIGTGSRSFTTQAGLAYSAGQRVRAASAADVANYMEGVVASYSGTTLAVTVDRIGGSGTLADWNINLIGQPGATGPGYIATSATSRGIGTGTMSFTTQENLAYTVGARVRAAYVSDPGNYYMEGIVSSYAGASLAVDFDRAVGSGTYANWTINLVGDRGATGKSYGGTSATSLLIEVASKAFTTQADLAYLAGARVRAFSTADPSDFMEGAVASYSGTTLTIDVDLTGGSGTHADWLFSIIGTPGVALVTTTSITALTPAIGELEFGIDTAFDVAVGARVKATSAGNFGIWAAGLVLSVVGGTLTLDADGIGLATEADDWVIGLSGDKGDPGTGSVDTVNGQPGPLVVLDGTDIEANVTLVNVTPAGSSIADALVALDTAASPGQAPWEQEPSAATLDIGALPSVYIELTGSTTATSFGTVANKLRFLRVGAGHGPITLTNNSNIKIKGGVNRTMVVGDLALCISDDDGTWDVVVSRGLAGTAFDDIKQAATDTATGVVELATTAEAQTGTDTARAVTPAGLRASTREKLTANRTYYVRSDGSDSNTGLANTSGGAFLTIPKGLSTAATLDFAGYTVTISVGAGSFAGGPVPKCVGQNSPTNLLITGAGSGSTTLTANAAYGGVIAAGLESGCQISGMTVTNSNANGYALHAYWGGKILIGSDCAFSTGSTGVLFVSTDPASEIRASASFSITANCAIAYSAQLGGSIILAGITITYGTRTFTVTAYSVAGTIVHRSVTNSGTVTGQRYDIWTLAVLTTSGGGASAVAGSTSGTTNTGAQYD